MKPTPVMEATAMNLSSMKWRWKSWTEEEQAGEARCSLFGYVKAA
ncbi:hypothetical protein L195_g020041 [Trifolium pratense]|uniref:Uncharacterized protein n=1 Tax=Trifolium pratense TaxID=57577 RepID=A0A2K3N1C0_TRIPR|nr:hypothetical protein L195_g020041 [Trifolium pratense]